MKLHFDLHTENSPATPISITAKQCVVAGWAGRDSAAIEHHILELAELGVPRPSAVPLFYLVAANQLIQDAHVQVVGPHSSGEVEVLVFDYEGELCLSIASDHTDRALEAHSVALSKQICVKPTAATAWRFSEVADHWDQLELRSWIVENDKEVPYQDGTVATLLNPLDLIKKHFRQDAMPAHAVMTCGTVATIGTIRPASTFMMELFDPVLKRSIRHQYEIEFLAENN